VADSERKTSEDDSPEGEATEAKKILGLAKPLFIKVAIGLFILLLAGSVPFFLISSAEDAPPEQSEVTIPDSANNKSDKEKMAEMAEKIMTQREQSVTLKEENIELREYILGLQTELNTLQNGVQKAREPRAQRKPDTRFLNSYGDDSKSFPPIVTEKPKPRPDPSWGEFKRPAS
jgi:hypothetical protein